MCTPLAIHPRVVLQYSTRLATVCAEACRQGNGALLQLSPTLQEDLYKVVCIYRLHGLYELVQPEAELMSSATAAAEVSEWIATPAPLNKKKSWNAEFSEDYTVVRRNHESYTRYWTLR